MTTRAAPFDTTLSCQLDEVVSLLDIATSPELRSILSARFLAIENRILGTLQHTEPAERPDDTTWDVMRRGILERDGHRGKICQSQDKPLHVHHIVAVADGGATIPNNLLALCDECHAIIHPWLKAA